MPRVESSSTSAAIQTESNRARACRIIGRQQSKLKIAKQAQAAAQEKKAKDREIQKSENERTRKTLNIDLELVCAFRLDRKSPLSSAARTLGCVKHFMKALRPHTAIYEHLDIGHTVDRFFMYRSILHMARVWMWSTLLAHI